MTPPQSPQPESTPRVPLTARIDADLHAGMREAADALDWSTNSVLNEAVREFLQRRQDDTARLDRPDGPDLVELRPTTIPGRYRVVVDGFPVPHLTAAKLGADEVERCGLSHNGDAFGWAVLTLDDRYQTKAMQWGEFWPMAWFMANAMAVAAGYSSHGPNATRINPHGPNEDAPDFAAWAERGWVLADARGSSGFTYELNFTFRLPAMDGADLQVHALREQLVDLISTSGGRDVSTRTVALRPLQTEPPIPPIIVRVPADQIAGIQHDA
jgi:hypothetical protein